MITGTIGSHLKSLKLQTEWQKKKTEEYAGKPKIVVKFASKEQNDKYVSSVKKFLEEQDENYLEMRESLRKQQDCTRGTIEFKLKYGGKFSTKEMEYIRANCPDLYAEVLKREKEREAYAKQLSNCKSKDEVFQFHMSKMGSFMSEVKEAESTGNYGASFEIRARLYNVDEEYNTFIEKEFPKLRWKKEIREEEEAKAKEPQSEKEIQVESVKPDGEEKTGEEIQKAENDSESNTDSKDNREQEHKPKRLAKNPGEDLTEEKIKAAINKYKQYTQKIQEKSQNIIVAEIAESTVESAGNLQIESSNFDFKHI